MNNIEQQVDNLRPVVYSDLAPNFHKWMISFALLLVIVSIIIWSPIPLMFALFFFIVGISSRNTGENIKLAVLAYDTSEPTNGEAKIVIESGDDSVIYYAEVQEQNKTIWKYQFIPQLWLPVEGSYRTKIWYSDNQKAPVLATTEQGVMVPRYNPVLLKG